jgi:spore maturation protein CgeB
MLLEPARHLHLSGEIHGVRYPWRARLAIRRSGLRYRGWLANHLAPAVFARHRFTVHVPRRPYVRALPGVPTIRVFEALASGIPLICSYWEDSEQLFTPGRDYLLVRDQREMESAMRNLRGDRALAAALAEHGRETILARHTCGHRVDELLAIDASLRDDDSAAAQALGATG